MPLGTETLDPQKRTSNELVDVEQAGPAAKKVKTSEIGSTVEKKKIGKFCRILTLKTTYCVR